MKLVACGWLVGGAGLLVLAGACSTAPSEDEQRGTSRAPLDAWVAGAFAQVLRVNPGDTQVRDRCELTVPLSGPTPLTFAATGASASGTIELGWKGSAVSAGGLQLSECVAYPCEVLATYQRATANGAGNSCQLLMDDGTGQLIGASSGTALTFPADPSEPIISRQMVKLGAPSTAGAHMCVLRQSGFLGKADVTNLSVAVNGSEVLGMPGPIMVGNTPWPSKGPAASFGKLLVGSEVGATRLKHVTARNEGLAEGDAIRCAGTFERQSGSPSFDVNVSTVPAGNGLSVSRGPTAWTCSLASFGTGDGCQCGCGILDPDCAPRECNCSIVNRNTGFENAAGDVSPWVLYGTAAQEDWADFDAAGGYATIGDGDYGVALAGWLTGPGGVFQDVAGTAGTTYSLSADVHVEPNFNPSTFGLKIEWWDAANQLLGAADNSLVGALTPGSDATNPAEWKRVSVQGTAPTGTARVTAVIYHDGTTDIGGLQGGRVDNVVLVDGPEGCSTAGPTTLNVTVPGGAIANRELYVATLEAGNTVTLSAATGTVTFNTSPTCSPAQYVVGADGLDRATYDFDFICYGSDLACSDPLMTDGHAGLFRMEGGVRTFVGAAGDSWKATKPIDLFLGVNDCIATPNSGAFSLSVTIE